MKKMFCLTVVLSLIDPVMAQSSAPLGGVMPAGHPPIGRAVAAAPTSDSAWWGEARSAFAAAVDLEALRTVAVQNNGRLKILDTLARETVKQIYGRSTYRDPVNDRRYDPMFTLLDLTFNGQAYAEAPLIYVENLAVRRELLSVVPQPERDKWLKGGRLSPRLLMSDAVASVMGSIIADLRKNRAMGKVQLELESCQQLAGGRNWLILPPRGVGRTWRNPLGEGQSSDGKSPADTTADRAGRSAQEQRAVGAFAALGRAWRASDAAAVNAAAVELATAVSAIRPKQYPAAAVRQAELWYNKTKKFTFIWPVYGLAALALLISLGTGRRWLRRSGAVLLGLGFAGHTAGMAVRMVLAGRYTIHNQYESFITLSWFAVLAAVIFVIVKRQWLFGVAGAALGAVALMVANVVPIPSSQVAPVQAILHTSNILYFHVNVVIISYALISLGFVISLFYLANHYFGGKRVGRMAAAGLGEATELAGARSGRAALLGDLDHAQLVVLQLAFWLLGVGILLGAYWADHAWGRWWGWDPKEVWALVTWMVYLVVIHLRLAVKDRGLVTAWLSVVGFFTMLWTHWGVNLLLSGLHSYA